MSPFLPAPVAILQARDPSTEWRAEQDLHELYAWGIFAAFGCVIVGMAVFFIRRHRQVYEKASPKQTRQNKTAPRERVRPRPEVAVQLSGEEKRVPVATEVVRVPPGVTITVKRTRAVEHAIEVNSGLTVAAHLEGSLASILKASVQGEIERKLGRTYKQTSVTEYEVRLDGEKSGQYRLTWIDVLITGKLHAAEIGNSPIPFGFRDRAELEVVAVDIREDRAEEGATAG